MADDVGGGAAAVDGTADDVDERRRHLRQRSLMRPHHRRRLETLQIAVVGAETSRDSRGSVAVVGNSGVVGPNLRQPPPTGYRPSSTAVEASIVTVR